MMSLWNIKDERTERVGMDPGCFLPPSLSTTLDAPHRHQHFIYNLAKIRRLCTTIVRTITAMHTKLSDDMLSCMHSARQSCSEPPEEETPCRYLQTPLHLSGRNARSSATSSTSICIPLAKICSRSTIHNCDRLYPFQSDLKTDHCFFSQDTTNDSLKDNLVPPVEADEVFGDDVCQEPQTGSTYPRGSRALPSKQTCASSRINESKID
jgi:hypothetical protein